MKIVAVEDALGLTLCQDMTQIIPNKKKGPRFRRGHVITQEDIPILLSMGKQHVYVWEEEAGRIHEEEAARMLYQLCANENLQPTEVKEGKIEAIAQADGLLTVDKIRLDKVNSGGETMIATRADYAALKKGETAAGMRIIPLTIEKAKMLDVQKNIGDKPLLTLHPFTSKRIGIVNTGSEVYHGRIKDGFEPVLREKAAAYSCEIVKIKVVDDHTEMIEAAIREMLSMGCDIVLCTGGMSVDADDLTPKAIREVSDEFVCYGTPVLPGSMFALAYMKNGAAIMGLPGAVMFSKKTIFDLIFPRVMADIHLKTSDIAQLGCGGLL